MRVRLDGVPPNARHVGVARATIADEDRRNALELINNARRPIILAGHGIMLSGAMPFVRELAENARHSRSR